MKKKTNKTGRGGVPKIASCLGVFFGTVFVVANLVFSQTIPPLYPTLVENEKEAVPEYLISIKKLPLFSTEYLIYKNKYGRALEEKVMKEDIERAQDEKVLLELLKMAPGSPELFARLALLYRQGGKASLSEEYAGKAIDLDPGMVTKINNFP